MSKDNEPKAFEKVYGVEDFERVLKVMRKNKDPNLTRAAKACSIKGGRNTVTRFAEKNPWFQNELDHIQEELFDEIESVVYRRGRRTLNAAKFLLTMHPEGRKRGYGKRTELTGRNGGPITWKEFMDSVS